MSTATVSLDEIIARLGAMPPGDVEALLADADKIIDDQFWVPNPGPQTRAFYSEADELFFGGEAGGGKSALIIGLSLTEHERSLILRRTNKEAEGLVDDYVEVLGSRKGYNGQENTWRIDGRVIDLGGVQHEDDKQKYKGRPRDFYGFDEITDFSETQYTFITGWNRNANPKQRCRIVATGNPPTTPEGLWVIKRWAAWLDPQHPNPAEDGELRWYTTGADGQEIEVDGRGPHLVNGEEVAARSRTFIRSRLSDNPDLARTNYASVLAGLPEGLRRAYRDGRFDTALEDDLWQAIPTGWVREAQHRWTPQPPLGVPQCAMGIDVAQGGKDQFIIAARHDGWYAPFHVVPGKEVPDGKVAAGHVITRRRDQSRVIVDLGGGWGGDCYGHLKENGIDAVGYMGVKKSAGRTADNKIKFTNVRTMAYWRFREALDPSQDGGSPIMLPLDNEMVADLCAPKYRITPSGLAIESKEDVVKRLGRSTDKGDAVVMAWVDGLKNLNVQGGFVGRARGRTPQVVTKKR